MTPASLPVIELQHVEKSYSSSVLPWNHQRFKVLRDINFRLFSGEIVGLIGLSGEGKSTLARLLLGLESPDNGSLRFNGQDLRHWKKRHPGKISAVFQDYTDSVNPTWNVGRIIEEPLAILGRKEEGRVAALLLSLGLDPKFAQRYPHELSGGQLQRVCIARALISSPVFTVFDEAVSSLDVSIQTEILTLLKQLHKPEDTWFFISHNLTAVTFLCSRLLFLHNGTIVTDIPTNRLSDLDDDYANQLVDAILPFKTNLSNVPHE